MKQQLMDYQELTWLEARPLLVNANVPLELIALIDAVNPSSQYTFIKAAYPYGTKILDNGVIQLPNTSHQFVKVSDNSIPYTIQHIWSLPNCKWKLDRC